MAFKQYIVFFSDMATRHGEVATNAKAIRNGNINIQRVVTLEPPLNRYPTKGVNNPKKAINKNTHKLLKIFAFLISSAIIKKVPGNMGRIPLFP